MPNMDFLKNLIVDHFGVVGLLLLLVVVVAVYAWHLRNSASVLKERIDFEVLKGADTADKLSKLQEKMEKLERLQESEKISGNLESKTEARVAIRATSTGESDSPEPASAIDALTSKDSTNTDTPSTRQANLIPKAEWRFEQYSSSIVQAIVDGQKELEQKIYDAFLKTPEANDPNSRARIDAKRAFFQIAFGESAAMTRLQALAQDHPSNPEVLLWLARAYRRLKEPGKSADIYLHAAMLEPDPKVKLSNFEVAVDALMEAGRINEAQNALRLAVRLGEESEKLQISVLKVIRAYAESAKNNALFLGVSEKILDISPVDSSARFSLAFRYGELNISDLSAYHYSRISENDRNSTTWNNLGVEYHDLKLPIRSIASYRVAEEKGDTLAMSNIAQALFVAGFEPEARTIFANAMKTAEHHKRIPEMAVALNEAVENESKSWNDIEKKAALVHAFYVELGLAASKPPFEDIKGVWDGPRCPLDYEIKGETFTASGTYEVETSGIAMALLMYSKADPPKPKTMVVEIVGNVFGRFADCKMKIFDKDSEATKTLIGIDDKEYPLLIAFANGMDNPLAYEPEGPESKKLYSMKKIARLNGPASIR